MELESKGYTSGVAWEGAQGEAACCWLRRYGWTGSSYERGRAGAARWVDGWNEGEGRGRGWVGLKMG